MTTGNSTTTATVAPCIRAPRPTTSPHWPWRSEGGSVVERDNVPGASEARAAAAVIVVPPMSKAERLHRWAASVELSKPSYRRARNGARVARVGWSSTKPSPLAVALEEWAFQAEGLRSARWEDVRAFFDLSQDEMRYVLGTSNHDSRGSPAAAAAERIHRLAEQAEATAVSEGEDLPARGRTGPSVRSSRWLPGAASRRRAEAAGAASWVLTRSS